MRAMKQLLPSCLMAAVLVSNAADAQEMAYADKLAARDFGRDISYLTMVDLCRSDGYADLPSLQQSYETWRSEHTESIAKGAQLAIKMKPETGKTEEEWRASMGAKLREQLAPSIHADPTQSCGDIGRTLATGTPLAFSGETLTSKDLRYDIYKQGMVVAIAFSDCRKLEAISSELIERPSAASDSTVERWTFSGCGKTIAMRVQFAPAADGGTGFSISPESKPSKPEQPPRN